MNHIGNCHRNTLLETFFSNSNVSGLTHRRPRAACALVQDGPRLLPLRGGRKAAQPPSDVSSDFVLGFLAKTGIPDEIGFGG